jgi:hypothetical protein
MTRIDAGRSEQKPRFGSTTTQRLPALGSQVPTLAPPRESERQSHGSDCESGHHEAEFTLPKPATESTPYQRGAQRQNLEK